MLSRLGALVVAGLTITAAAVFVPASVSSASTKSTSINVAVIGATDDAPLIIGQNVGIFAHYGLSLNLTFVSSPTIVYGDLLSGNSQIGFASIGSLVPADVAGEGVKCFSNLMHNPTKPSPYPNNINSLMVAASSPITSPAQLVGKTVGIANLSATSQMLANMAVTLAGGNWSKVNLVSVPYANMAAEIANGTIAAAVEDSPYYTEPGQQQLMDLDSLTPGSPVVCWSATASYISSHRTIVNHFADAIQQSTLYMQAHPSLLTTTVMAAASGLPATEASSLTVPSVVNYGTDLNPPGLLSYEALMKQYGYLTQAVMPLSAIDYIPPGTPMTKLLFNAAGKFIVKKTITCVKGKLTSKVTGVSPKCPSGYHLKK